MPNNNLDQKLLYYKIAVIILTLVIAVLFFAGRFPRIKNFFTRTTPAPQEEPAPLYSKVMKIIEPLSYSGLQPLLHPDVSLEIDFKKQIWLIRNIHHFDAEGKIILDSNRYGLCGELAAYVAGKIRPLFKENYKIQFARVAESGFFLNPEASHIVVLLTETNPRQPATYIIDPSFHRYGNLEDYDDYLVFETNDFLTFLESKLTDTFYRAGHGTPILIENEHLISLAIEKSEGNFDQDNFTLAILATRRYKYSGRYLLALRNIAGKTELFENKSLAREILTNEEYELLRKRLFQWFEALYSKK